MKLFIKILLTITIVSVVGIIISLFFIDEISLFRDKNKIKTLIEVVENYNAKDFIYQDKRLIDENRLLVSRLDIEYDGYIKKDEYGNIYFELENEKNCIFKTPIGNIIAKKGKCDNDMISPIITLTQNNAQITVEAFDNDTLTSYMISSSNNLKGDWKKIEPKSEYTLVENIDEVGEYYIWFSDASGNISNVVNFKILCKYGEFNNISDTIVYCTTSIIRINNERYFVLKDIDGELTLFYAENKEKLRHCELNISEKYCYYKSESVFENYRWSKSKINYYLNNEFMNSLPMDIKDRLVSKKICDNSSGTSGCDGNDGCGGYLHNTIEKYNWKCEKYTESKIRLLTYEEFSEINDALGDKTYLYGITYGKYWTMNSYSKSGYYASAITEDGKLYLDEPAYNELLVRPVFTLIKK